MSHANNPEEYWNSRSENLKSVQSDRSSGSRNSVGRRQSRNGHVHGSYRPASKLPTLQSPTNRSNRLRNGRYPVVPPVSAKAANRPLPNASVGKSSWTRPPLESSNEGRNPHPQPLTVNVPRVIDNANYRNYLKKRFPRIAAVQDEVRGMTPEFVTPAATPGSEPTQPPVRRRMKKPKPPPPPPTKKKVAKNETMHAYTYFCEHSVFAAQYTEDIVVRFLDEELIADIIIDAVQESFSEKMYYPTTDLFSFWIDNELFSNNFVESFLDRVVEDEIIPDVLIEVISENRPSKKLVRNDFAVEVYHELLTLVVPNAAREISSEVIHEQYARVEREMHHIVVQQAQYTEVYASALLNEFIVSSSRLIVREVVIETATDEMYNAIYFDVMHAVFVDFMRQYGPPLVLDAYAEATAELFFEQEVFNVVLYRETEAVAMEVLTFYDTQLRRKDLEEIMNLGKEKPVATIALDHCLSLIADQQSVKSANEVLHKMLEGLSLDVLFDGADDLVGNYRFTAEDDPLKKFHEKATLDVAVDVLARELIDHADEDLADLDFAEIDEDHIPRYVSDIDATFYGDVNTGNI